MSNKRDVEVKAICAHCEREVSLRTGGLHMTLYDNGASGFYSFFCPLCVERSDKPMDLHVMTLLNDAGVKHTMIHVAAEFTERLECKAPAISTEDMLDLYLEMKKTPYLAALATSEK